MSKIVLGKGAVKSIHQAIDNLFDRLAARVLGGSYREKRVHVGIVPDFTLPELFRQASVEERNKPNMDLLRSLLRTASGYMDAQRIATKTKAVHAVESALREAEHKGVDHNVGDALSMELTNVWKKATDDVKKIVDTEATHVRNTGTLDGILKVSAANGIEDPIVFFVVVRDEYLCDECKRLHLSDDGVTPRVWKLSQLGHGYHKRGEEDPKIGGLHPHCRCSLVTLLPGYGFDENGMVTFIDINHDQYSYQAPKTKKSEVPVPISTPIVPVSLIKEEVEKPKFLPPLLDDNGNIVIGTNSDFRKFSKESHEGVFVGFKASDAAMAPDQLAGLVQKLVKSVDIGGRIFLNGKVYKIFVSDKHKADEVMVSIQQSLLEGVE